MCYHFATMAHENIFKSELKIIASPTFSDIPLCSKLPPKIAEMQEAPEIHVALCPRAIGKLL